MPETIKMDRTWLCSVLFMDIAAYSSQSVELQINLKQRFNQYLTEALHDVPDSERVILDTGDGAAICFLGAPETAMFTALRLWQSFIQDKQQQQHGLRVRLGVNLGPVKLVKDINGSLNALGDGMNAGQRIMSFATENQILVSQSYYEVVSRLSDDYKTLFSLKGTETDKHVREHTVYHLLPPGAQPAPAPAPVAATAAPPATAPSAAPPAPGKSKIWIVAGIAALLALGAFGASQFLKSPAPTASAVAKTAQPLSSPPLDPPSQVQSLAPAAPAPAPKPAATPVVATKAVPAAEPVAEKEAPESDDSDAAPLRGGGRSAPSSSPAAVAEFQQGMQLVNQNSAADALPHFDKALAIDPNYVDAHVGRAEARRMLDQYELSVPDCNSIISIAPDDPRGYNCRGLTRKSARNYDAAIADFTQAIKLNPRFVAAYFDRGNTYTDQKQYTEAIRDYTEGLKLRPRNPEYHLRRAKAYADLKQFDKAIEDYSDVIRAEPNNLRALRGRALAEDGIGDAAGAAADRKSANAAQKARKRG